jgi:hypothetical protein
MDGWMDKMNGQKNKMKAYVKHVQVGLATLMLDVGFKVSTVVNGLIVCA